MVIKYSFKNTYLKTVIFALGFIFLILGYVYLLNFYSKNIISKITEINSLKEQILQNQVILKKENQLQKTKTLIEQKANKELSAILFDIQQKLDRDFEETKNLILDKIQEENWQAIRTSFNEQEKKLNFVFQINQNDFIKFYNFMTNTGLLWQTIDLKAEKNDKFWQIELNLQTK